MRVSTQKDDIGYVTARDFYIYLDGKLIEDVVTADEGLGYILRYKHNDDGEIYTDEGEIATEELYGKVEIKREVG